MINPVLDIIIIYLILGMIIVAIEFKGKLGKNIEKNLSKTLPDLDNNIKLRGLIIITVLAVVFWLPILLFVLYKVILLFVKKNSLW